MHHLPAMAIATVRPLFLQLVFLFCCACLASAGTVFTDGFEAGNLGPAWTVSTTNQGRVTVTSNYSPAAGQYDMVLDDSVIDAIYSTSQATLSLNLVTKKNVVLSFQAKSLGNAPNPPPSGNFTGNANFDGVSVSVDGGTTWRAVTSLATVPTSWQTFTVTLDAAAAALGGFTTNTLIRFSEYGNASAPIDGIAIDQVAVTADDNLVVELDLPSTVSEGGGTYTGYVLFSLAPTQDTTVSLSASTAGQLALPASVVVPAGQTYATFNFSVIDNNVVDFARTVTVTPACTGYTSIPSAITVYDNEVVNMTLNVPAQLAEGQYPTSNATVSIDRAGINPLTVTLFANPASEVSLPASVTIPAGATSATFTIQAVDDTKLDGNQPVTVTASATGLTPATAQTTTIDNDQRTLAVNFTSATMMEGSSATGTVVIGGTLTTALTVNLTSSNPASATVPASVTIPAGSTQATFSVTAPDNNVLDGSRLVTITATAATFTNGAGSITVRDNDAASYRITGLTDIVNLSSPTSITVAAVDIDGNVISGYTSTVNLSLVLPDGTTQALTPATAAVAGTTGWTGSVTIPAVNVTPLKLRATDAAGTTGDSAAFDVMRVINLVAGDVIWDATRARLYASVAATDTGSHANQVVSINPLTLQVIGSVSTGNNPGQLALTSDGTQLYVALNGNGYIDRISPDSMTVNQSFSLGTVPNFGTCYANDMCTVAGQPNTLVVARKCAGVSPSYVGGVAAYDNGVARANVTTISDGVDSLESSASSTLFFGYNSESTEYGFRQLQLGPSGISVLAENSNLISGFSTDIRSAGNTVFSTSGAKVDGAQMKLLGEFPVNGGGPVCPDPAANRVYFLEEANAYSYIYNVLGAYDPNTFSPIATLSLPVGLTPPSNSGNTTSFVRWGANGLAIRTATSLVLINSTRLVPTDPPANLNVQIAATPNPASTGASVGYTVTVTNKGPNPANGTELAVTLSSSQTILAATASQGAPAISGLAVSLPVGTLASGASDVLLVTATPLSAGSLTGTASTTSNAVDPDTSDNTAVALVSVGFQGGADTVNPLRLPGNNLIYDPTRALLWTSLPSTVAAPLGRSVVAIDPLTGLISEPIALGGSPVANCMALSGNGRYLYVGLSDSPQMARVDLSTSPATVILLPLGMNQWNEASYAQDVQPLDGDGTSFLLVTNGDDAAWVYDGAVPRANKTSIYTVTRVERTGTPGTFVSYNGYDTAFQLSSLVVTSTGVSASQTNENVISGFYADLKGAGNLALSSTGLLVNSSTLTLSSNLGITGRPCLDFANGRAYIVSGSALHDFDTATGLATGSLTLPVTLTGDWALNCVRWGLDGFAVLGSDGNIYIARWSSTIPASIDSNNNGIPDAWEATWFNSLNVSMAADSDGDGIPNALEYLFNTSPTQTSASPFQIKGMATNASGQNVLQVVFPRRPGLGAAYYEYQVSSDLVNWTAAQNVVETVLPMQTANGVSMDTVQASITMPNAASGFVRLVWVYGSSKTNALPVSHNVPPTGGASRR